MRTNAKLHKDLNTLSVKNVNVARKALRDGKLFVITSAYNHMIAQIQEARGLNEDIIESYNKLEDMLDEIESLIGGDNND